MNETIVWLPQQVILQIHDRQIERHGGLSGVRDEGLLESALERPLNANRYGETDLCVLAALYASGLVKNHPFLDGNKRTGWLACELFIRANGLRLTTSDAEGYAALVLLITGDYEDAMFADWLRENCELVGE